MSEHTTLFERAAVRYDPPDLPMEGLLKRRDRKRRNQRIAAGLLGLAIGLGAILVGSSLLRSNQPAPAEPAPIAPMANGPLTFYGFTGGLRSLTLDGQRAHLVRCGEHCTETSSAAWSPDGSRVAFAVACSGGCATAGDPYHGIRVFDLATGADRLVVGGEFFEPSLDWSADGSRISYVHDGHIHIIDADGSNPTQVTTPRVAVDAADWSPDGTRFVLASGGALSVIEADGSDRTSVALPSGPQAFAPQWSPDGARIAYRSGCIVWTISPNGEQRRRIVDLRTVLFEAHCGANYGSSDELTWSPDGRFIAVIAGQGVVVMKADGKGARALPAHPRSSWFGLTWQPIPLAVEPSPEP